MFESGGELDGPLFADGLPREGDEVISVVLDLLTECDAFQKHHTVVGKTAS